MRAPAKTKPHLYMKDGAWRFTGMPRTVNKKWMTRWYFAERFCRVRNRRKR